MGADAFFIISSFVMVVAIFFVALLFFSATKPKTKSRVQDDIIIDKVDYESVMLTLGSSYSTLEEAQNITDLFFKHYREWELTKSQKKGFLFALCLNKKVNSKLILRAKRKMIALEPKMKKDIEAVVKRAVDLR